MPKRYSRKKDADDVSVYENEHGQHFYPDKVLGQGFFALSRAFKHPHDSNNQIVVLRPNSDEGWDPDEVGRKINFFDTIYPEKESTLFSQEQRAIVPFIEGESFNDEKIYALCNDELTLLKLLTFAAEAIQSAHDKGLVIIDIHPNNILYNSAEDKCYLIDGGLSHTIGEPIYKGLIEQSQRELLKKQYPQIAPECFRLPTQLPATAVPGMDVYAFGIMLKFMICEEQMSYALEELITQCIGAYTNRPSMREIIETLKMLEYEFIQSMRL